MNRKNLNPCFYPNAVRDLIPIFNRKAIKLNELVDGKLCDGPMDFNQLTYAANVDILCGN